MAYDIQAGAINHGIRKETIDAMIKQIQPNIYKFKQACAVVATSSYKNTFFREDPTVLAGQTGNTFNGIPRGAAFPQQVVKWEEVSVRITKFGAEDNIMWEDIIAGDLAIQTRTVIKLTEGVAKKVDDAIWTALTDNYVSGTTESLRIQSYAITTATGGRWDESSAAIIKDLFQAARLIGEKNYDTSGLMAFISPKDKKSIMNYLAEKGAQFPSISTSVTQSGDIGSIAGISLVVSNSVPASYALVVKPKVCATWKELVPLQSTTVEDPYRSLKIRVVEEGVTEVTDPLCVVLIKNTQSGNA